MQACLQLFHDSVVPAIGEEDNLQNSLMAASTLWSRTLAQLLG